MRDPERTAAETLGEAVNSRTFVNRIFAMHLTSEPAAVQPAIMTAFLTYVDSLAERDKPGLWDELSKSTILFAKELRELIIANYGCFPPPLE